MSSLGSASGCPLSLPQKNLWRPRRSPTPPISWQAAAICVWGLALFPLLGQDWSYGTETQFVPPKLPAGIVARPVSTLAELNGRYEGQGVFSGDRRFNAYQRFYRLEVKVRNPNANLSPLDVQWSSRTDRREDDGSIVDAAKFTVRDARTNGSELWGSLAAEAEGQDQGPLLPWLALAAEKSGQPGMVLLGRYEGPVFLLKK